MNNKNQRDPEEFLKIEKLGELFFEIIEMGLVVKPAKFYEHRINYFRGSNFL